MSFSIIQQPTFREDVDTAVTVQGTFPADTVSGRLLIALACAIDVNYDEILSIGFTDGGTNTFSRATFGKSAQLFNGAEIGYAANCVGKASHQVIGTPTVVALPGPYAGLANLTLLEVSGMATSNVLDAVGTPTTGTDNAPTGSPVTPAGPGLHVAIVQTRVFGGTHTLQAAAGWSTVVADTTAFTGYGVIYRAAVQGVQQTPSWAMSETNQGGWVVLHAVFKEAVQPANLNRMLMGAG